MSVAWTEERWLSWRDDPHAMIEFIHRTVSARKMRLFYCACVRRRWSQASDARSRAAVEASELFADGRISSEKLLEARKAGYSAWYEIASQALDSAEDHVAAAAFMCANEELVYASGVPGRIAAASGNVVAEYSLQAVLLRDLVGNPFRPALIANPLSPNHARDIVALARTIYDERAFDRMPLLGDALEKAGCDNSELLSHCRDAEIHARGSWVVDLLLGNR